MEGIVVTLGLSRDRGRRRLSLLPAVTLACAAFAVPYLAAAPSVQANSTTQLEIATFSDTGVPTDGVPLQLAVIPADANGNTDTCFNDKIHYSDPFAIVPPDYTFNPINWGIFCTGDDTFFHGFQMTPLRPGPQTLTIADLNHTSIKGTFTIDVLPGSASSFVFSALRPSATLGSEADFSLTVKDHFGYTATNYTGTVQFTSTDPAATLPSSYTFNASDAGTHIFPVTFNDTGSRSVTVTDTANASVHATATTTVSAAPHFEIWTGGTAEAGYMTQWDIDSTKADGTPDTSYTGTVHLTSTDPNADLGGADIKFAGGGSQMVEPTFFAAGTQTLTATDTLNPAISGTATIEVLGGDAVSAAISGLPAAMIAGPVALTVTEKDAYGNNASSGAISFTSSDPKAILPVGLIYFHPTNYGTRQFSITMETEGSQTVTITGASGGSQFQDTQPVTVLRGQTTHLSVSTASSYVAGVAHSVTVKALDAYGNTDSSYQGAVHFTSTDTKAALPADYTFLGSDAGFHVFAVTLKTAGTRSVTATDTVTASIKGSQSGIVVTPAAAKTLVVAGMTTPRTAGTTGSIRVTAADLYGNRVTGYRGTVRFTSTDKRASLPADYAFVAADNGTHVFAATVILKTVGTWSVTATDKVTASIKGTQAGIVVNAAALSMLVVSGMTTPRTTGSTGSIRVTATDAYGNRIHGYLGTVHFTSTDPAASLPANYTFTAADAGTHVFVANVILNTAGTWSVTATDTVTVSIKGSQTAIVVN
jgi:hypothetical protein